jgi:hypothetical protein
MEASMSRATRLMAGLTLIAVPTIEFGGSFLLASLIDRDSGYTTNALRQSFFRAGHAHAGVLTILSLLCQIFVDAARLSHAVTWLIRIGAPLSGILMSAGFFLSVVAPGATEPGRAIVLIYAGAVILAASVVSLGIGLLRMR